MGTTKNKTTGLIKAVTAGIIIGLLIAPEKGHTLRKKIRHAAANLSDKFSALLGCQKEPSHLIEHEYGEML